MLLELFYKNVKLVIDILKKISYNKIYKIKGGVNI